MDKFIQTLAKKAGKIVLGKFGKVGVKYTKRDAADVVTEADLASNRMIVGLIKKRYPEHGIISEELGEDNIGAEYVWIIDPLDGTRNFSRGVPLFCVIVGLARKGRMELGAIFDPVHNELFFAKRGKGAFLNGKRIQTSRQKNFAESWGIGSSRISKRWVERQKKILRSVNADSVWVSTLACIGLQEAYTACGRRDWLVSQGSGGIWDFAAGALLLEEAGCRVTNTAGKRWTLRDRHEIVAANQNLHPTLIKILFR